MRTFSDFKGVKTARHQLTWMNKYIITNKTTERRNFSKLELRDISPMYLNDLKLQIKNINQIIFLCRTIKISGEKQLLPMVNYFTNCYLTNVHKWGCKWAELLDSAWIANKLTSNTKVGLFGKCAWVEPYLGLAHELMSLHIYFF